VPSILAKNGVAILEVIISLALMKVVTSSYSPVLLNVIFLSVIIGLLSETPTVTLVVVIPSPLNSVTILS
jgi:hypothetical protein